MLTTKHTALCFLAPLTLFSLTSADAQYGGPKVAIVTADARPTAVARGGSGVLFVTMSVSPQFHINAHHPNDPAYIATVFQGQPMAGIKFGAPHYPAPKAVKVSYSSKLLLVYLGKTVIAVPFTISRTAKLGKIALAGTVSFQGCDTKSCYPPASAPVRAVVTIK